MYAFVGVSCAFCISVEDGARELKSEKEGNRVMNRGIAMSRLPT